MPAMTTKHRILAENAAQIWQWFQERGGIAVWKSVDMSNAGRSWTTPLNDADGQPTKKQDWRMQETPSLTITDSAEVIVDVPKEVKRFRVAIKVGTQGMLLKCSDASSRRIRRECEKAGQDSWYEFDYTTQEAVVFVPGESKPLPEYVASQGIGGSVQLYRNGAERKTP
jgi:hypothetical protein